MQTYFHGLLNEPSSYPASPIVDAVTRHRANVHAVESVPTDIPPQDMKIAVIGDRVMTDVILANRMNLARSKSANTSMLLAVPILTTTVWQMEGFGSRIMRVLETFAARKVMRYYRKRGNDPSLEWVDCVRADAAILPSPAKIEAPARASSRDPIELLYRFGAYILSPIFRRLRSPVQQVQARLADTLQESRKIDYGYRLPATMSAILRFRRAIMGFDKSVSRS